MKKLLVAVLILTLTGCATIVSNTAEIKIETYPSGAEIWVDGEIAAHSPATIEVSGDVVPFITIKKKGYKIEVVSLEKDVNSATYANLLLGPFYSLGKSVDVISGDRAAVKDAEFSLTLEKVEAEHD